VDSLLTAAARALATGDTLGALARVGLREDPPALALRGIAMAQLGEHSRARELLRRAARGFGAHEALARARCVVAEAEVALAMRELGGSSRALEAAAATLASRGDHANAAQARLIALRRLILIGRLGDAAAALEQLDLRGLPPMLHAFAELAAAELALRSLRTAQARAALARAHDAAERSRVPALGAEVAEARALLDRPVARRLRPEAADQPVRLDEVQALLAGGALVVDGCRHGLRAGARSQALASRPLLFTLARALAQAWPGDVDRSELIALAFRTRRPDETHRARLRVEMSRLRTLFAALEPPVGIDATTRGFALRTAPGQDVVLLVPPIDGDHASLLALLADGAAWSTSALALATGANQRTVQRALAELHVAGQVRSIGRTRAQRWLAPPLVGMAGFATILLLPPSLPLA
jgi:tetratricopeptide (TPR) repeat protein